MLKSFLCLLGILLAVPFLALIVLACQLPVSVTGIAYLLAGLPVITGSILAPWMPKYRSLWLVAAGLGLLLVIAGTRIAIGMQNADSPIRMITLPQARGARWTAYLIDEQDAVIFGEALFQRIGGTSPGEHAGITQALYQDFSAMRQVQGVTPSPVLDTYLGLQRPSAFDVVVIGPQSGPRPDTAVIFLHGFMGNVTAQCWEISQAAGRIGAVTVCPSAGWIGEWWQPQGEASLRATFAYLREQGIRNIYLGGFSNGGFGISRLASKFGDASELRGLIFVDGIANGEAIRDTGLPVLIIQGTKDERMPASEARRIAGLIGNRATYVEIEGEHFLIMKEPAAVQQALAAWLQAQAGK
jgi:pimeloyl-ACP methyl ester carboxylesterase